MKPSRWIVVGTALLFVGAVALPAALYVAGGSWVGPYDGPRGLASYLGALYAEAGRGGLLAWMVVLGPLLAVGIWPLRAWALRKWAD